MIFTIILIVVLLLVAGYFYATSPKFKAVADKSWAWIVAAAVMVGTAIAAWFNKLPAIVG